MVFRRDVSLLKSPNKNLETPLHCAAKVGNENVIHNLIQIDPVAVKDALEQKNENGDIALHVAATYDHIGFSLALMKLDPKVAYKVNNNMFSALNVAIDRKYTKLVQTMLEQDHALAYTKFSTGLFPVHLAASTGNKELVLHLMEKYPTFAELLDPHGRNLFHVAAEKGTSDDFQEIFKNTSVREIIARMNNAQDYEGNTPLHVAAMKGDRLTMRAIYDNKMNHDAEKVENKQGLTPFKLSKRQVEETYKDNRILVKIYLKIEGHKFSLKWFDKIMRPPLENKWERTQVIGLGSVLITTVAFAATFSVPGGYNQDHGTPVLGRRYMFRAFILANALAFIAGFLSLFVLLVDADTYVSDNGIGFATALFAYEASSMVVAFGLGMYVTLAPVCLPIAILLLVVALFLGTPASIAIVEIGKYNLGPSINYESKKVYYYIMAFYAMTFLFIFCLAFL